MGATAYFSHVVTNTGNIAAAFDIGLSNAAGEFDLSGISLARDDDGNGGPDGGALLGNSFTTPPLEPGQSLTFLVTGSVPSGLNQGAEGRLNVTAQGNVASASAGGFSPASSVAITDTALANSGAQIELRTSIVTGDEGAEFVLSYTNIGGEAAKNITITEVIGYSSSLRPFAQVLGVGAVDAAFDTRGLAYIPSSAKWNGNALSDGNNGDEGGISFYYDSSTRTLYAKISDLPAGQSGVITFGVTIEDPLPTSVTTAVSRAGTKYQSSSSSTYFYGISNATVMSLASLASDDTPDLAVAGSGASSLIVGQQGVYTFKVSNKGYAPTSEPVVVTIGLPAGIRFDGLNESSAGYWICSGDGQWSTGESVQCLYDDQIHSQSSGVTGKSVSLSMLVTPQASVFSSLPSIVTTTAEVSGGGEDASLTADNQTSLMTEVLESGSISGRLYIDADYDGAYTAGVDEPLTGWLVYVCVYSESEDAGYDATIEYDASIGDYRQTISGTARPAIRDCDSGNIVVSPVTVDSSGSYTVTGLAPTDQNGDAIKYKVQFRESAGVQVVGPPSAGAASPDIWLHWSERYLVVTLGSGDLVSNLGLPWDPNGVIFDSSTRQPIAGATVTLIAPPGFDPDVHLLGGSANVSQVTGAGGWYQYIFLPGFPYGDYTLQVTPPPSGYLSGISSLYPPQAGAINAPANCTMLSATVCSIDPSGSVSAPQAPTMPYYFLAFTLSAANTSIELFNNHIPLDPDSVAGSDIVVQKSASRTTAEIGDFVNYEVSIASTGGGSLTNVALTDTLPLGFHYVRGSLRLNGEKLPVEPDTFSPLHLSLGTIPDTNVLTYRVRLDAGADRGDGVNRVSVTSDQGNATASAAVEVEQGVFSDRGFVLGTVYADCNRNRLKDADEPGVPGVRLIMEDGTQVVTDGEGKYSLYGLTPKTHVLRVDNTTLPSGTKLEVLGSRNAGNPNSRFVDISNGELVRADFAIDGCSQDLLSQLGTLVESSMRIAPEMDRVLGKDLKADAYIRPGVRSGVTSGIVDERIVMLRPSLTDERTKADGGPVPADDDVSLLIDKLQMAPRDAPVPDLPQDETLESLPPQPTAPIEVVDAATGDTLSEADPSTRETAVAALATSRQASEEPSVNSPASQASTALPEAPVSPDRLMSLEQLILQLDSDLAFVEPLEGEVVPSKQTRVRVKGKHGSALQLRVNGKEVDGSQIGKKTEVASRKIAAWEYIGVSLTPGKNKLELVEIDPFGNEREHRSIQVTVPAELARIVIDAPARAEADEKSVIDVRVKLFDADGVPVSVRTAVTLTAVAGEWLTVDASAAERGLQTFVTGGEGVFRLQAPNEPKKGAITVTSGLVKAEKPFTWTPNLRPLVAVGIVEGALRLNSLNMNGLQPARERDGFEREIKSLAYSDGTKSAAARTALYLKGKVRGNALLTLAYDNDKDTRDRVFRDIQPDEYYPVYGDSSTKSFDAQSSGRFYVRVDKDDSFVLYGDFKTDQTNEARKLSRYGRLLTGVQGQYDAYGVRTNAFASQDTLQQIVLEIPANGTSGPFSLGAEIVDNSERVEVLTRDRNQTSVIIEARTLRRFADYEIDSFTGRLMLKSPLASYDENLNPLSIRVTAETEGDGAPFWTYGAEVIAEITEAITIGVATVQDQNPDNPFDMNAVTSTIKLGPMTTLTAEAVQTGGTPGGSSAFTGSSTAAAEREKGTGVRMSLRHTGKNLSVEAEVARTDEGFSNQSSSVSAGRSEAKAKAAYKLTEKTRLLAEAVGTEEVSSGGQRIGALVGVEHSFGAGYKIEAGLRASHETAESASAETGGTTPNDLLSARLKATAPVPGVAGAAVFGELEQDLFDTEVRSVGLGGDYRIKGFGRAYVKHYLEDTIGSSYALNDTQRRGTTLFGVTGDYMEGGKVFSEYRINDAVGGREAQAAIGLDNGFQLSEGLRLLTQVERVTTVEGEEPDSTAVAAGLEYTAGSRWKGSVRGEHGWGETDTALFSTGVAMKIDSDWTALARGSYDISSYGSSGNEQQRTRVQGGLAYRDSATNRLFALGRLEWRDENLVYADGTSPDLQTSAYILSLHGNYQANRDLVLSGRYATKWVLDDSDGIHSTSLSTLLMTRLTYDIFDRWDVGLQGSTFLTEGATEYGLGTEIGYRVMDDLWLSGGYNYFGFKDDDLAGGDITDKGFFIRLRWKFDENLFRSFLAPGRKEDEAERGN